ncbi:hypothetical protein CENSYa_1187 [Cenarchaeum symbiosum A]|uniref:Uncharacterized protein n=1 Tax=Cenarchaeum symbiosum (strain A) TaxID=414004 RepID=A0RWU4_CENSY|nr:hypothetical protein CENSYa_1187 [Cenarchaeum symbiosum A]
MGRYDEWNKDIGYDCWTSVEMVFEGSKKIFGESVQARKAGSIMREILIRVSLYNRLVAMYA